jgi:beta-glucanase (GH16 family)
LPDRPPLAIPALIAAGAGLSLLIVATTMPSRHAAANRVVHSQTPPDWVLTWSDEFNAPAGSPPDARKWTFDIGGGGWGNHELETYTNRTANAEIEGGNLVITARKEEFTGPDGVKRNYTSARLKTLDLFSQTYGRFEARIKIPAGQGMWPAFWMMGNDITKVGWPKCGEIDVMENIGREAGIVHGSLHGPGHGPEHGPGPAPGPAPGTADETSTFSLPAGQAFSNDFHVFAIEWEPAEVRFYVDAAKYATFQKAGWPAAAPWVFDHPFFILLNVAVGGDWPGPPEAATQFPQQMLVDYVRVYKKRQN